MPEKDDLSASCLVDDDDCHPGQNNMHCSIVVLLVDASMHEHAEIHS